MKKLALMVSLAACATLAAPAVAQSGSRMIEEMQKADRNGDGAVSRKELLDYRASQFNRLDRNGDGILTSSDMPPLRSIKDKMQKALARFDTDHDGRVTHNEFINGPTIAFDVADKNKDGVVTRAELNAARARLEKEFGK